MIIPATANSTQPSEAAPVASMAIPENNATSATFVMDDAFVAKQQGLTLVSEADLQGPSEPEAPAPTVPTETVVPSEDADKDKDKDKDATPKADAITQEEEPSKDKAEEPKVPKGYVPLAAIKEARGEIRNLRSQLATLETELSLARATQVQAESQESFADFKVLSDAEFIELSTENPADALQYTHKLQQYNAHQQRASLQDRLAREQEDAVQTIFEDTRVAMEEALPGLFDEKSSAMPELRDFAESIGFTEDMFYLTDPSTKIILSGETTPLLLGEQAADVIRLLVGIRGKLNGASQASQAATETLRQQIEQDVLAKLKADTGFRSLSALPAETQNLERPGDTLIVSETEFASWPKEKQDAYLRG